jgi:hypothetical protein
MNSKLFALLALMALAAGATNTTLLAHHSQSQFEPELTISVEGTVEGPSPRQLETKGWGRAVSKPGDKVTFEGRPRRDGQPELLLLSVTLADGKTISFKPE